MGLYYQHDGMSYAPWSNYREYTSDDDLRRITKTTSRAKENFRHYGILQEHYVVTIKLLSRMSLMWVRAT